MGHSYIQHFVREANAIQLLTQDTSAGDATVTLPPAATADPNTEYRVKKITTDANHLKLAPSGADNIEGANATFDLGTGSLLHARVVTDGNSNWWVV